MVCISLGSHQDQRSPSLLFFLCWAFNSLASLRSSLRPVALGETVRVYHAGADGPRKPYHFHSLFRCSHRLVQCHGKCLPRDSKAEAVMDGWRRDRGDFTASGTPSATSPGNIKTVRIQPASLHVFALSMQLLGISCRMNMFCPQLSITPPGRVGNVVLTFCLLFQARPNPYRSSLACPKRRAEPCRIECSR